MFQFDFVGVTALAIELGSLFNLVAGSARRMANFSMRQRFHVLAPGWYGAVFTITLNLLQVFCLPVSFRQFSGISFMLAFKALIMVIEASFKFCVATIIVMSGSGSR